MPSGGSPSFLPWNFQPSPSRFITNETTDIFSLLSIELLLIGSIISHKGGRSFILHTFFQFAAFCLFVFSWGLFLRLPKPYVLHLQLIRSPSSRGGILATNGSTIWIFLHREMSSSSQVPFLSLQNFLFPFSHSILRRNFSF